jgi:hypothetical protein
MDKHPLMDRSFLIPIGISSFSIVGILIVLLIIRFDRPQAEPPATPTITPFKYIFLGTETSGPESEREAITATEEPFLEEPLPEETSPAITEEPTSPILINTPQAGSATLPVAASSPVNTPTINLFPGITPSPASTSTSPPGQSTATVGTTGLPLKERLDDTDPLLDYDGGWVSETKVANAYQGTLYISNTPDSDVLFSFTGQQLVIGYMGRAGLGTMTISIDDTDFVLNQSTGREWTSPQLTNEEHFVILIHETGASVNLDYINILGPN